MDPNQQQPNQMPPAPADAPATDMPTVPTTPFVPTTPVVPEPVPTTPPVVIPGAEEPKEEEGGTPGGATVPPTGTPTIS